MNCPACEATRDQASHLRQLLEADRARVKAADRVIAIVRRVVAGETVENGALAEALKSFDAELQGDAVEAPDRATSPTKGT